MKILNTNLIDINQLIKCYKNNVLNIDNNFKITQEEPQIYTLFKNEKDIELILNEDNKIFITSTAFPVRKDNGMMKYCYLLLKNNNKNIQMGAHFIEPKSNIKEEEEEEEEEAEEEEEEEGGSMDLQGLKKLFGSL